MIQSWLEFHQRMRRDQPFRQRILADRKDGTLAQLLAQEAMSLTSAP